MNTRLLGAWGEEVALKHYKKLKFKPVALGYRTRHGEIDIIVENKEYIVFAEVKLRKSADFAAAREFVDSNKQRRIRTTAEIWLSENETEKQPRFDVVEIYAPDGINTKNPNVTIIENAF
ncbi:MAG: YraN family protein [Oscillospiraceae bacterium]|nr:YraN family protein [Oscillospiraceae bacterium]MBQ9858355.1 YraN family protein [Oscillospiraceae bacterium]